MLDVIKNSNIIANHLHIPIQSGSDEILKAMNRRYDKKYFKEKVEKIRLIRPDISLTTDVIVGFPGETDKHFNETYEFIKEIGFSALHVFPYSKREGTKAALMLNQVDEKIKKERVSKLMNLSKELEKQYMDKFINKKVTFIAETYDKGYLIGHSSNYLRIKVKGNEEDLGKMFDVNIEKIDYPYCIGNTSD